MPVFSTALYRANTTMSEHINAGTRLDYYIQNLGDILTAQEVAGLLRIEKSKVYDLFDAGELQGFRIPSRSQKSANRRLRQAVRIFKWSAEYLIQCNLNRPNHQPLSPPPAEAQPAAALPQPKKPKAVPAPARSKSRVVLPYPGQNRSATPAETPSARTDGCNAAGPSPRSCSVARTASTGAGPAQPTG